MATKDTSNLQKEKRRILNTDRILRQFAKNKNLQVSITTINFSVHRSNATRLLKNLVRLGILKEESRGQYTLSDYMLKKFNDNEINLFELYKQVKDLLEYHKNNNIKDNMPQKTNLTREDIKYLMLLDGLLICDNIIDNIINEHNNTQPNADKIINNVKSKIEEKYKEKYGNKYRTKYIDRTIDKIQTVLKIYENKTTESLKNMKKNEINNINVLGFITSIDLKFNPSFKTQRTSIFDSLEDL